MSGNRARRAAAFEALAASFGGSVRPSDITDGPIGMTLRDLKHRGSKICQEAKAAGSPMQLEVGILVDLSFNAVAGKVDGVDLIGINAGVPLRLLPIFEALLATQHAFPDVGTPEARSSVKWSKEAAVRGPLGFSGSQLPNDGPEIDVMQFLATFAERFIFEHEATHVRHGHVDWIQARFGAQPIDELRIASTPNLSGLDLQTLEFDADCGGMQGVMELIYTMPHAMAQAPRPGWQYFGKIQNLIKAVSFAIYTCCQIFADSSDDDPFEVILERSHPPATFRMHCVTGQLMTIIGTHFTESAHKELFFAIFDGVSQAHAAWQEVFGGTDDWHSLRMQHETRNRELLLLLQNNWAKLYSALLPLKRYNNLAPPDGLNAWPHVIHRD
ncbi:hypothetical protein C8J25_108183 [Sphingomonas faeni]|uniref:Uncharacterized protein n=1 Tax=Sphingomonas faeni TaxID=185950 RepID=A0A2T5U0Q3_9SPHN|nr:hypothetical protein [Sphingomonas faeni]PTW45091.1 hypothetical protein C8J25_108183 [Sphingomonas faeni]